MHDHINNSGDIPVNDSMCMSLHCYETFRHNKRYSELAYHKLFLIESNQIFIDIESKCLIACDTKNYKKVTKLITRNKK